YRNRYKAAKDTKRETPSLSCRRVSLLTEYRDRLTEMKLQHTPALAIGIGVVAGLRPMMALAVVAWGLWRRWIRPGRSPYARIVSAHASKRIAEFAIRE